MFHRILQNLWLRFPYFITTCLRVTKVSAALNNSFVECYLNVYYWTFFTRYNYKQHSLCESITPIKWELICSLNKLGLIWTVAPSNAWSSIYNDSEGLMRAFVLLLVNAIGSFQLFTNDFIYQLLFSVEVWKLYTSINTRVMFQLVTHKF